MTVPTPQDDAPDPMGTRAEEAATRVTGTDPVAGATATDAGATLPGADPAGQEQPLDAVVPEVSSGASGNGTATSAGGATSELDAALALADARLGELQRERADFVNFRRRAERDVAAATAEGMARLVESLLPVLDEVRLAREHGDMTEGTPFAAIADKLEATLAKAGVQVFGEVGEPFDPAVHEALLHEGASADVTVATCTRILQAGYRINDRVVRPARVAVTDPA